MKYDTTKDTTKTGCVRDRLRQKMEEHLQDKDCSSIKCARMEAIREAWLAADCTCGDPEHTHMEGFTGYRSAINIAVNQHLLPSVINDDGFEGNVSAVKVLQHVSLEVETMNAKDTAVFIQNADEALKNAETSECLSMLLSAFRCLMINQSTTTNIADVLMRTFSMQEMTAARLYQVANSTNDALRALISKGILTKDEVQLIDTSEISVTCNHIQAAKEKQGYVTPEDIYQAAQELAVNQGELDEIKARHRLMESIKSL